MPVPAAAAAPVVPASLASVDSAVVMVHSQVPHLAYPHFAASMYAAHPGSLVTGPPAMAPQQPVPELEQQQQQMNGEPQEVSVSEPAPAVQETASTWAEEPQDEALPVEQSKQESNTWTNSNYRGEQGITPS